MTKSQLITIVSKQAHLPKRAAREAIEVLFEEMIRALAKGDKVVISGFGTFVVSKVKAKEVTPFGNVDKKTTVEAHHMVTFRQGTPLRNTIW